MKLVENILRLAHSLRPDIPTYTFHNLICAQYVKEAQKIGAQTPIPQAALVPEVF